MSSLFSLSFSPPTALSFSLSPTIYILLFMFYQIAFKKALKLCRFRTGFFLFKGFYDYDLLTLVNFFSTSINLNNLQFLLPFSTVEIKNLMAVIIYLPPFDQLDVALSILFGAFLAHMSACGLELDKHLNYFKQRRP